MRNQVRDRRFLYCFSLAVCVLAAVGPAQGQGACCTFDDCLPAADVPACNALNGVFLDGEDCSTDPCGPGACCFEDNCLTAEAFPCITAGREFAGAGTTCLDDPCDSNIGACCLNGTCTDSSPDDCDNSGGTWQGAGTDCTDGLCELGSCCSPGSCAEQALFECNAAQGDFLPGEDCVTDPCEVPNDCALNSLFSQSPDGPVFFTAYTSEASAGLKRYENFSGVVGAVDSLKWWGLDLEFDQGNFTECAESDPTFEITFHESVAGIPGPTVCSYTLLVTRTPTGIDYQGSELNEYEVTLPGPCVLVDGWVSVVGQGDPSCWFLWISSPDGDELSYCDNCEQNLESNDLSVCMGGTTGGVTGACCDQSTGSCTDDVAIQNCVGTGLRFTHQTACADLDPPCSAVTGGCCFGDGSCFDELPDSCEAQGGEWLGANASCDLCPAVGACCLNAEICSPETQEVCDAVGQTWLGVGVSCQECPDSPECRVDALFAQSPNDPSDFVAGSSEANAGFFRSEDITAVAGAVESLEWWGLDMELVGETFVECVESNPEFQITFREDAGGVPGAEVCSYVLTSSYLPTGLKYLGAELNAYGVTLPTPCVVVNGWVSIVGLGDPDCWFLWMSSDLFGDSYCEGCLPPSQDFDVNVCLGGAVGGVFGACCDDDAAACQDNVEITNCLGLDQRFRPGELCAGLDPPCGTILGACCVDDATCSAVEQTDCQLPGETWLGANTLCDQCPCVVPCTDGGIPEGEPPCGDDYVDTFNGGCFAAVPAFSPISIGDTVCGESGVFLEGGQTSQGDFDWYELEVTTATQIVWSAEAEFRPRLTIYDASNGCPGIPLASNDVFECEQISVSALVQPGTYWLVIHPNGFSDSASCPSSYRATVTNSLSLTLSVSRERLSWNATPGALAYDVVRGDLGVLGGTSGDFTVATEECLADDFPNTQLTYTTDPGPGEAFWFLARAVTAGGNGTYDSTGTMQVGARDAEVNASPNACP